MRLRWKRSLMAGMLVPITAMLVITLVVTGFAFKLAFAARGAPDQAKINAFAISFSRSAWLPVCVVLTFAAAFWAGRPSGGSGPASGLIVGAIGAIAGLCLSGGLSAHTAVEALVVLAAGWVGGFIASRGRSR